jgi:hypothetical protein
MKRLGLAVITLLLFAGLSQTASAQVDVSVGPRLGIDAGDVEEVFLGADVRIQSPAVPVIINPTFDYYFTDDPLTFWGLSANALFPFGVNNQVFTPYAGAGLGIFRSSIDDQEINGGELGSITVEGESTTDIGLNLIFGAQFLTGGPVAPFVEAHYTPVFADPENFDLFGIRGGLLFSF